MKTIESMSNIELADFLEVYNSYDPEMNTRTIFIFHNMVAYLLHGSNVPSLEHTTMSSETDFAEVIFKNSAFTKALFLECCRRYGVE